MDKALRVTRWVGICVVLVLSVAVLLGCNGNGVFTPTVDKQGNVQPAAVTPDKVEKAGETVGGVAPLLPPPYNVYALTLSWLLTVGAGIWTRVEKARKDKQTSTLQKALLAVTDGVELSFKDMPDNVREKVVAILGKLAKERDVQPIINALRLGADVVTAIKNPESVLAKKG